MVKVYLVSNKEDDYGACNTELVETTPKLAAEYYNYKEIADEHVEALKKYFELVSEEEERERTNDRRFYGVE